MAVANIDTVYQRVLALANKEQRGYITPQEFNLLAGKAQNDIFEMYFHDYKTALLSPGNQSKSADDIEMLREKIAIHRVVGGTIVNNVLLNGTDVHWLESVYIEPQAYRTVDITFSDHSNVIDDSSTATSSAIYLMAYYSATWNGIPTETSIAFNFNKTDTAIEEVNINEINVYVGTDYTAEAIATKFANQVEAYDPYHSATASGSVVTVTYNQLIDWAGDEGVFNYTGTTVSDPTNSGTTNHVVYEEVDRERWSYIQSNKKLNPTKNSRGIFYRQGSIGMRLLPEPSAGETVKMDYITTQILQLALNYTPLKKVH